MKVAQLISLVAIFSVGALALSLFNVRPASAVGWSNPHHAYVIFQNTNKLYYVKEIPLDKKAAPRQLGGTSTGLCQPNALAIGPGGTLYVSGRLGPSCQPAIEIFAAGAQGNVRPIATIAGANTRLAGPGGIAFDTAGNLFESDSGGNASLPASINEFAAGVSGNIQPIARITGSKTQLHSAYLHLVAVGGSGAIFAGDSNTVLKFPPGSHGNVAPSDTHTVQSDYQLNEMQVGAGNLYASITGFPRNLSIISELNTADLSPISELMDPRFTFITVDVDGAGNVYVQDFIRSHHRIGLGRLFKYEPGGQQPSSVRWDGESAGGGYIVVGP